MIKLQHSSNLFPIFSLLILTFLGGCNSDDSIVFSPPEFTSTPSFSATTNSDSPLSGTLTFETDTPTQASILISDGTDGLTSQWIVERSEFNTEHSINLVRFKPGRTHSIVVSITNESGVYVSAQAVTWTAPELPALFPEITVHVSELEQMESGFTLFDLIQQRAPGYEGEILTGGYIVIVDNSGDVVWYNYFSEVGPGDTKQLENGNFQVLLDRTIVEIDNRGSTLTSWSSNAEANIPENAFTVDTDAFHHEITKLPNGNIVALSVDKRAIDNYPFNPFDLTEVGTEEIAADAIVEFLPTGEIVRQYSLLDILNPLRIGFGSERGFHNRIYPGISTRDWTHGNAIIYDESTDSFILSLRHQDATIKVSRENGKLEWILGTHQGWSTAPINPNPFYPDGEINPNNEIAPPLLAVVDTQQLGVDFEWPYHQHAPQLTQQNTLMIYDNGNMRATPYDLDNIVSPVENYTRAVEYRINESDMSVEQVWEYRHTPDIYTSFIGDADMLEETTNVLITFGGITLNPDTGEPVDSPANTKTYARLIEVTHETPATKVFDLQLGNSDLNDKEGWRVYRSERIKSF